MKEEVERIKKLVGIDHNRWEQPCTCDKCKNMCKVPCIGTPKDIEAIIDAGYADRLKETMWMVGYLAVKEKPIAMIQPTEKDGWCAFRQFVHEFDGNILKMVGYFRGSKKDGQIFCDMITERIEKYEKRISYDKGKLNN